MCGKCLEHDAKIDQYRRISRSINDKTILEGIATLVAKHEAQKKALHSDQK
jgi:hypothetical protein